MAYTPFGDRKSSGSLAFEEFVPPSAWTEDSTCHYLLVDLPGFKRQELKLQVDNQTHIVVSGERQVRENKYKRFEQSYELPKNADIEKITGKLDGEILYISVPKKIEQHHHQEIKHEREVFHEAPEPVSHEDEDDDGDDDDEEDDSDKKSESNENEDESDGKNDEKNVVERKNPRRDSEAEEDWGKEADLFLRLAIEKLRKNKGIVMTAIFAFSLGVLVTQKLQSNQQ